MNENIEISEDAKKILNAAAKPWNAKPLPIEKCTAQTGINVFRVISYRV